MKRERLWNEGAKGRCRGKEKWKGKEKKKGKEKGEGKNGKKEKAIRCKWERSNKGR